MSLTRKDKFRIFWRDGFTCLYCGRRPPNVALEVDHYEPVSLGGADDDWNLITACESCNGAKSDTAIGEPCADGCSRPMCGGPRRPRDGLEAACQCVCHTCAICDKPECDGWDPKARCETLDRYRGESEGS